MRNISGMHITLGFTLIITVALYSSAESAIIYSNPRVYNVDYSFEMSPDPNKIDRSKDLKVWIPIPREWDSQKAVRIISAEPEPHAKYIDPEYGNPMLFWDFGRMSEQVTYRANIKFRLESYDVSVEVDPNLVGPYDKVSREYRLYTRSTHTISITPKIREMAQEAVGDEENPYLQAERIFKFVRRKVRYKLNRLERGVSTEDLLNFRIKDENTGEEYYEGACDQQSTLFIALCRAVLIPARSVVGFVGWNPWSKEQDLKLFGPRELEISPDGLAGTQHYLPRDEDVIPHIWAELYIPDYGWIPVDVTGGSFGHFRKERVIMSKGRDVRIGPNAPHKQSEGYGFQWVSINNNRADALLSGVFNIAKIRIGKVKILHHSDPFPADGLTNYGENTLPKEDVEEDLRRWRKEVLSWPSRFARRSLSQGLNVEQFYTDYPRAKEAREAFVCHMLRRQLGNEMFSKLVNTYVDLRQNSNQPVSTSRFQKLAEDVYGAQLDWFFARWVSSSDLPRLKLEEVAVRKNRKGWRVRGRLLQSSDPIFRLPIELAIDTQGGREMQKLWVKSKATAFEFRTQNEPQKLVVDPDYEVLKIQKMPPRLEWIRDVYPNVIVIYGTLAEAEANKSAAERFNNDYLWLGSEIIRADTDVNEADLKAKCVVLIGRPETNKVAQQCKDILPVEFDGGRFTWQETTYDQPTQGVAQVVENPNDAQGLMMMYAGLSPKATLKFCDLYLYDARASFVIFDGDKQLVSGDWEGVDNNLFWNFETRSSARLAPSR